MIVNELAQWAVLLFLAIFVFGLTRQLGRLLLGTRGELAADIGPDIGKQVPRDLLPEEDWRRFETALAASRSDAGAIAVLEEDCPGCERILAELSADRWTGDVALAAISRTSSTEHERRMREMFDVVAVDEQRVKRAGIRVSPFIFIVDHELRIRHKAVTPSLNAALAEAGVVRGDEEPSAAANGNQSARLDVIQRGARK